MNKKFLEQHKTIHFIGKCIKNINNKDFIDKILYDSKNPEIIQFNTNGMLNQDKNIMIISNVFPLNGFFAEMRCTLKLLAFAERYHFVPYIRYNSNFLYAEKNEINGTDNPFEYYFKQCTDLSYKSVMNSYNVFKSRIVHSEMLDIKYGIEPGSYNINENYLNELASVMKKYIELNAITHKFIYSSIDGLFGDSSKIIGIHHRGTDYKKSYRNHPQYIPIECIIKEIDKIYDKYDKIFVATDDQTTISELESRFHEKICYYRDVYRSDGNVSVAFSENSRKNHKYKLGLEVLRDMYTLAYCNGLISGMSQVSLCSQILKKSRGEKYEYLRILDYGINKRGAYFTVPNK